MKGKGVWPENRCLGSTTVGPRGQVVIPVNARKELGIDAGTTLLVFKALHGQGLVLLKVDAIEQMIGMVSQRLNNTAAIRGTGSGAVWARPRFQLA